MLFSIKTRVHFLWHGKCFFHSLSGYRSSAICSVFDSSISSLSTVIAGYWTNCCCKMSPQSSQMQMKTQICHKSAVCSGSFTVEAACRHKRQSTATNPIFCYKLPVVSAVAKVLANLRLQSRMRARARSRARSPKFV